MSNCAVVRSADNFVVNVIVAEVTDLAPDGCFLVDTAGAACQVGWLWDGAAFVDPNPAPVVEGI